MTNVYLLSGAVLSATASLLHLGCIYFGPSWYRFFGAGERMAQLAASGHPGPALVTLGIAFVLGIWSLYAFSGAGMVPRLPLLRLGLCVITSIYLLRATAGFALAIFAPGERGIAFWVWSSLICLVIGVLHLLGTRQSWATLVRGGV